MSRWLRVVLEPAEDATVQDLDDAVRADHHDDPETEVRDGRLVWKRPWSFPVESVRDLDVPAASVLVTKSEDTAGTTRWFLFEPLDGEFVLVDAVGGGEHRYGADAFDHLALDHGIEGVQS